MFVDVWENPVTLDELTRHDIWHLRRGFLERLLPRVDGINVLEVGSGPGQDSLTFAERGAAVTAVDCSLRGLKSARAIYESTNLPIQVAQCDARALPFADRKFDLVFNAGVLEHFVDLDLDRVVAEMIRVTRPGGAVLAFCPNRFNVYYQYHLRRVRRQCRHRYEFERALTAGDLKRRFSCQGLVDVRASGVHVHPAVNYLLPAWLPKHHRIEPLSRWSFFWLERISGLHGLKSLVGQDVVVWGRTPTVGR